MVYRELDDNPNVISYIPEPLKIPYLFCGKKHHYIPDILVTYSDGHKELIEVKTMQGVWGGKNEAKYRAAREYATRSGIKFRIWIRKSITEGEFESLEDALKADNARRRKYERIEILIKVIWLILIIIMIYSFLKSLF